MQQNTEKPLSEMTTAEKITTWKWRAAKAKKHLYQLADEAKVDNSTLSIVIKKGRCGTEIFDAVEKALAGWGV